MTIDMASALVSTLDLMRKHVYFRGVTVEKAADETHALNILVLIPHLSAQEYQLLHSTFRTATNTFGIVDKQHIVDEVSSHEPRGMSQFKVVISSDTPIGDEEAGQLDNTFDSVIQATLDHTETVIRIGNVTS